MDEGASQSEVITSILSRMKDKIFISGMCAWKELRTRRADYTVLLVACLGIILFLMLREARSQYLFGFVPV